MAPVEAGGAVVEVVVEVAYSPAPRRVDLVALTLPMGSTVEAAVAASGLLARHAVPAEPAPALAVWGRLVTADTPLRMHDRVELLRPLLIDPKESRRQRYRTQAERRPGRGSAAR
jgi:hypothetical protein